MTRFDDGSAGDANYGAIARDYSRYRRPDPRIAAMIHAALGGATRVLNVGAGAGSYAPTDRSVVPVEPSASMRARRPAHLPRAVNAVAEHLPFADLSFDAAMTTFSVHQWSDVSAGLKEMRRVTRGPIAILTCDPDRLHRCWIADYAPEVITTEARRYPPSATFTEALGTRIEMINVPIPLDCVDGFNEAYYGRPEMLLDPDARSACSAWSFVDAPAVARFEQHLKHDLESGAWDAKHRALRSQPSFDGSLILVVAQ